MGIRSLSSASITTGTKRSKFWDQSAALLGDFESIATTTVGSGGAAGITFSSIPSTYKHLQVRFTTNGVPVNNGGIGVRFNGDTGNNYYGHYLWTYGGGTVSSGATVGTFGELSTMLMYYDQGISDAYPIAGVIDIMDYTITSKYKTIKGLTGRDSNGSGQIWFSSGLWKNGSAVNSLTLTVGTGGFLENTKAALYGIKD